MSYGREMSIRRSLPISLAILSLLVFHIPASAQQGRPAYSGQDHYRYCQQRAETFSGYTGPVPSRHLPGGALEGAARGAATGAVGSWVFGKNKKQRKKAARRGAIIGGLVGAMKRSAAKKEIQRSARAYRLELDACMRSGGY